MATPNTSIPGPVAGNNVNTNNGGGVPESSTTPRPPALPTTTTPGPPMVSGSTLSNASASSIHGVSEIASGAGTQYESSLFGIANNENCPLVMTLIASMCGGKEKINPIIYHEIYYVPCVETPTGPLRKDDIVLRLRSELDVEDPEMPKHLSHTMVVYGQPEPRTSSRGVNVRPVTYSRLHNIDDAYTFIRLLGYRPYSDFVHKGYWSMYNQRIKISVYRVFKTQTPGDVRTIEPADLSGAWIVHVSSLSSNQDGVNHMAEQLKQIKRVFQQLVTLNAIDHIHLQNKIPYSQ
ncbi:hypothetical protein H4219_005742 [Mycoemilia scoparia]|uniref:Mediator of RNA polymerase II transcription subunit 18 n=1 Tax=Mycoemilia scoparia TaxID=417184 RepID=A0A9W7ZTB4_9FUNG|nr:hypothetical protein H4219_005742 [Mycoemilia scoparia]